MSDDEEAEAEGTIRQVMPGETAAKELAAQAAAANALLPTDVSSSCLALCMLSQRW